MARIVKAPQGRRAEIVETADRLFRRHGYAKCSVEMIVREMGVAKGTFYSDFKSKPDTLEAIVCKTLSQIGDDSLAVAEVLHMPGNRELHELNDIRTVLQLSPILAKIVEQGIAEGIFEVERPLEAIQFLFTGAQLLTDGDMFCFMNPVRILEEGQEQGNGTQLLGEFPTADITASKGAFLIPSYA